MGRHHQFGAVQNAVQGTGDVIYDVVIVGAGPAGLYAALGFADKGFRTLVLEAQTELKRKLCGEYLCPRGVDLLERSGHSDLLLGFGKLLGMRIFSPNGTGVETHFPLNAKLPPGASLNRQTFEERLAKKVRQAGATIETGVRLQSLQKSEDEKWVEVTLADGRQLRTRLLVGADGRKSHVSRLLSNDTATDSGKRVALHCYAKVKQPLARLGEMHILPGGNYVGINPIDDKEVNISIVTDGDFVRQAGSPRNAFFQLLDSSSDLSARFKIACEQVEIFVISPLQHKTKAQVYQNIALIGDAAGFVDPLTGEGIYHALHTAHLLVEQFGSVDLFSPKEREQGLANYAQSYKKVFAEKRRLNFGFQKLIRMPWLVNFLGWYFSKSKKRADAFIGIIGNVYTPSEGLVKILKGAA